MKERLLKVGLMSTLSQGKVNNIFNVAPNDIHCLRLHL